jgi:sporulation protein YhbH
MPVDEFIRRIEKDHARFRQIVRGKVREDLRKYISRGELIGKEGKDVVSIPVPQIELPKFHLAGRGEGGVGQGEGEEGDALGVDAQRWDGGGGAGDQPGEHILEVEFTIEELAEILGEELGLPRIKPKGADQILTRKVKFTGIYRVGPQSLRHFRRTYKQALKRTISSGLYNPEDPVVVPVREDFRYRSWKEAPMPQSKAVVIYMMDVSGSMGDEQKELVRITCFWLDTWLRAHYKNISSRYITHDASAREVDRDTFFRTKEAGGTMISSAYKLCAEMIEKEYSPLEWNIYAFHFSDGDNWSSDDSLLAIEVVKKRLLPAVNQFAYGQVKSPYGSGQFLKDLTEHLGNEEAVVATEIDGREKILDAIKVFLQKGR